MNRFCRYQLRTTDVDGARSFYAELFGDRFWGEGIDLGPLPAQASARGAPPYWLGHIGVEDVVASTLHFVQQGATRLGHVPGSDIDARGAIVRDPAGAIVALTPSSASAKTERVAWHLLSARDETTAFAVYAELFGWSAVETFDLGPRNGRHVSFTWDGTKNAVGSAADIARLPHVHPQWLYFFRTENLSESLARVRAMDGLTLPETQMASGDRVAVCDDPQGAAFALLQPRHPAAVLTESSLD